ncbi:unnamed protein product [Rotaria sp. Silwood2]|nr:unnamed protein product [Rotaria sp. Silwood2]CAF2736850.1 unnamed protein product [Rotaria sp. Silwood2]CAF4201976.1 unnamed protein product [Rotaria sp. Silwood2]CAF4285784.1 unnamed protein product [Rotaria sp. Silwood2]
MSFARLLSANNHDDDETNSLSETGVIVKDIIPRSMVENDDCACTCSCCPSIFNWCIKDACGLSCGIMTWILFLYAEFVFVFVILTPKTYSLLFYLLNLFIFHLLEFLAIASHLQTMFSNPGAVPLKNATPENLRRYENGTIVYRCAMCQSIKPVRAHHFNYISGYYSISSFGMN